MTDVRCPGCGGPISCVDSNGVWWRCYNLSAHGGEKVYDMSGNSVAQKRAADLRAQSRARAQATVADQKADKP